MRRNLIVALLSILSIAAIALAQTGDPRPVFQIFPMLAVSPTDQFVKVGDFTNHALRVNVVAGAAAGGTSSTFAATFPSSGTAAGARDASGFMASLTVTNAGRLNVTCDNCSSSAATFAAAFPSQGGAIGFKDGGGMLASATVDNAGNQFVIASQSSSSWTVIATGTISAHQVDTWTVSCSNCSGASTTNYGSAFPTAGSAVGFKDGAGRFASATVDNAGFLLVTASQGTANATPWNIAGTVTATGTVTAHQGDAWTVGILNWLGSTAPTVGQKTSANSLPVVIASDQSAVAATGTITAHQGDTWTVTCTNCTGSTTSNFGSAFPAAGFANFKDGAGRMASATVDNASNLFVIASQSSSAWTVAATGTITAHQGDSWTVGILNWLGSTAPTVGQKAMTSSLPVVIASDQTAVAATGTITAHQGDAWTVSCTNCSGASTTNYGSAFPASGLGIGFKDGAGRFASGTVDNASNLFVIASQGQANSGQAWFVNLSQVNGTTTATAGVSGLLAVGGNTATASQASGNPLRISGVAMTTGRALTDGQVGDLSLTTSSDLRVRADTSAATNTIAPARVQVMGGWGQQATATQVTICDNYASVSLVQTGNVEVITSAPGDQIKICSIVLVAASATAVGIFEGSGTLCNTNRTGIIGSHSTANGVNVATTGGFTIGNGNGVIARTRVTGNNVCLGNSTAASVAGGITWTKY